MSRCSDSSKPKYGCRQIVMLWRQLFAESNGQRLGQGCFGHLIGGGRIAEVFQAMHQLALHTR